MDCNDESSCSRPHVACAVCRGGVSVCSIPERWCAPHTARGHLVLPIVQTRTREAPWPEDVQRVAERPSAAAALLSELLTPRPSTPRAEQRKMAGSLWVPASKRQLRLPFSPFSSWSRSL